MKADRPGTGFRELLLWTYSRGTWQYDLICALILAFIFLTPPALLRKRPNPSPGVPAVPPSAAAPSASNPANVSTTLPGTAR